MNRTPRIRFARFNAQALSGAPHGGALLSPIFRRDMANGGNLHIYGTTTLQATGLPVSRKVRLFDRRCGILISEMVSDESGHYEFARLRAGDYFVIAHDHTGNYNAVIADAVTAEAMP